MSLDEKSRIEKIRELNNKWFATRAKDHDEESVIENFICPLLEILGWNLSRDLKREVNRIDCVLYLENKPYIGIEAKSFSHGVIDENKRGVIFNKDRLIKNCREICITWAVITRYIETIVYRVDNGEKVASFTHPNEYVEKFKELKILQKPSI